MATLLALAWFCCLDLRVLVKEIPGLSFFYDLASFHLEKCLGAYRDFGGVWTPPDYWDAADIALEMPEHPNVWIGESKKNFLFC